MGIGITVMKAKRRCCNSQRLLGYAIGWNGLFGQFQPALVVIDFRAFGAADVGKSGHGGLL